MDSNNESDFRIGTWQYKDFPPEIKDSIIYLSPRQRRKFKRNETIPLIILNVLEMLGFLPCNIQLEGGVKTGKLLKLLSDKKCKYCDNENFKKAEWLRSVIVKDDYEKVAHWVRECGGPQQPKSNALSVERRNFYKYSKPKSNNKKRGKNRKQHSTTKSILRRSGKIVNDGGWDNLKDIYK